MFASGWNYDEHPMYTGLDMTFRYRPGYHRVTMFFKSRDDTTNVVFDNTSHKFCPVYTELQMWVHFSILNCTSL